MPLALAEREQDKFFSIMHPLLSCWKLHRYAFISLKDFIFFATYNGRIIIMILDFGTKFYATSPKGLIKHTRMDVKAVLENCLNLRTY